MSIVLKNNASDFLAATIDSSQTSITLQSGASFPVLSPDQHFYGTIESTEGTREIVKVTARAGNNLTVVRGQDGTAAASFPQGSRFEARINVASVEDYVKQNAEFADFNQEGVDVVTRSIQNRLQDRVSVKDFGAVGDGVADDTAAIQAAKAAAHTGDTVNFCLYFPQGSYRTTSTIDLRRAMVDASEASIVGDHAGIALILGGRAQNPNNPWQKVFRVTSAGPNDSTAPTVRIIGAKVQNIDIERADYIQLYADSDDANLDGSIAYSTFSIKTCIVLELTTNPSPIGSSVQWINENAFYLSRIRQLFINGTYAHNNNIFYRGNFEGSSGTINIQNGTSNKFYDTRWEGAADGGSGEGDGPGVVFGSGTWGNLVVQSWISSSIDVSEFRIIPEVTNNGVNSNRVVTTNQAFLKEQRVYSSSIYDARVNTQLNMQGSSFDRRPQASVCCIRGDINFSTADVSDAFEVANGDVVQVRASSGAYRPGLLCFDSDMQPVALASSDFTSSTASIANTSTIFTTANRSNISVRFNTNAVAYCIAVLSSGSNVATNTADKFTVDVVTPNISTRGTIPVYPRNLVDGVPTAGYAPRGHVFDKDDGSESYVCVFALNTVLAANASTGGSVVKLTPADGQNQFSHEQSISDISASDIIGIQTGATSTHWTTVVSVSGDDVTITDALPADVSLGDRVAVVRWATQTLT